MERLQYEGTGAGRSVPSHASARSPARVDSRVETRGGPRPEGARGGGRTRRAPALWRARLAAGSLLLGAGAAATTLPGCETAPVVVPVLADAAVRLCVALVKSVFGGSIETLPPGYGSAHRHEWTIDDRIVTFCLYASPTPGRPVYLQIDCEGPYHEIRARRLEAPATTAGELEPASAAMGTASIEGGVSIDKLDCSERLLVAASLAVLEEGLRAESTFLATNARMLPRTSDFPGVTVAVDGLGIAPGIDRQVRYGDAVTLAGPPMAVAAYAHACGVREVAFTVGDASWRLVAHDEYPVGALFRDGVLEGARVLSAYGG